MLSRAYITVIVIIATSSSLLNAVSLSEPHQQSVHPDNTHSQNDAPDKTISRPDAIEESYLGGDPLIAPHVNQESLSRQLDGEARLTTKADTLNSVLGDSSNEVRTLSGDDNPVNFDEDEDDSGEVSKGGESRTKDLQSGADAKLQKRSFDSIGDSAFSKFGKRKFDSIGGNSAFANFGKRKFDSIGGKSAFTGFGKRKFDAISSSSAFTGFGKRKFDSIGGNSAFANFGKRKIDSMSPDGAIDDFGKTDKAEQQNSESNKIDFTKISGGGQDVVQRRKRDLNDKNQKEHKISKRNVAEGELTLALTGENGDDEDKHVSKRRFDSIDSRSSFRRFGRSWERDYADDADDEDDTTARKRRFDSIDRSSAFSGFGKRRYDSIGRSSKFVSFGKRRFDRIGDSSPFKIFGKRRFDRISSSSPFGGFGNRKRTTSDRLDDQLSFLIKQLDSMSDDELDELVAKINREKTIPVYDHIVLELSRPVDTEQDVGKRNFDAIGNKSIFGRFGRPSPPAEYPEENPYKVLQRLISKIKAEMASMQKDYINSMRGLHSGL